jgi:hypothetical protein
MRLNPTGRKATYVKAICDIRPQKEETHRVRLTTGGNLKKNVSTPTADITTIKTHLNSVTSDEGSKYMCVDLKDFYLNNDMKIYKYIRIPVEMIPEEFNITYNLTPLICNGFLYAEVCKGTYGLPQAGKIAQNCLTKVLDPWGYAPVPITTGLWAHKTQPINFTLVVDDFGIKHEGKEHALHLIAALLESTYKITKDSTDSLYIGITLKWDYTKRSIHCDMPGYVEAALHKFQHANPSRPQDSPYPWVTPRYSTNVQEMPIPQT